MTNKQENIRTAVAMGFVIFFTIFLLLWAYSDKEISELQYRADYNEELWKNQLEIDKYLIDSIKEQGVEKEDTGRTFGLWVNTTGHNIICPPFYSPELEYSLVYRSEGVYYRQHSIGTTEVLDDEEQEYYQENWEGAKANESR